MVPRSGRGQWTSVGPRAGDQAANAARDYGAAVYVLRGGFERAVPAERVRRRHVDQVPAQSIGRDSGRSPEGRGARLGTFSVEHPRTGRRFAIAGGGGDVSSML